MTVAEEHRHRRELWHGIQNLDLGALDPLALRDLGIYGGAQGIWVDKRRTSALTPEGAGVTVGILHTGRHYPDELSDEGLIYHYPETGRPAARDLAEVNATKAAKRLGLPIFVILRGERSASKRRVRLGWVEDWDDSSKQFLIIFGETEPPYVAAPAPNAPFVLTEDRERRLGQIKLRAGQQQFRFQVLQNYGCRCAVCSITHPRLIVAAHIRGKAFKGSDDWRNGLPLCQTHHAAFDAGLFDIEPQTLRVLIKAGLSASALGISAEGLGAMQNAPHEEALSWRWQSRSDGGDANATNSPASMAPASAPSEAPVASREGA
jgi:putative restriction endonuclease